MLLIDLDGTVRETISGEKFINRPDDQKLILGVEEAIARCSNRPLVGITNQGGVKAGFKSLQDAIEEQKITLKLLPQMETIYFCPDDGDTVFRVTKTGFDQNYTGHHPHSQNHNSIWNRVVGKLRKPGEGMLLLAMNYYDFSPENCLYVGDRPEDQAAALTANVPFMWAHEWNPCQSHQ